MKLDDYDFWLFDCDGVILDSNALKTKAFRQIGLEYGEREAAALVRYHVENGGASRYAKFDFFFRHILGESDFMHDYDRALVKFAELIRTDLRSCPEVRGIRSFLQRLQQVARNRTFVVSGSDGCELFKVLQDRDLSRYFDGIFGSPASKNEIVEELLLNSNERPHRPVFVGDGRLDYDVSRRLGIDFVMIYGYSEWEDWSVVLGEEVVTARDFQELSDSVT